MVIRSTVPTVGSWADHRSGSLDPREVAEVSESGSKIKIRIFEHVTEWLPAENYTYITRPTVGQEG